MKIKRTTTRDLVLSMSPGTIERTVHVPAGTDLVQVCMISGDRHAVRFVGKLDGGDAILAHDLEHRFLWVPEDSVKVEEIP